MQTGCPSADDSNACNPADDAGSMQDQGDRTLLHKI